jgi:hypothetical protein
MKQVASIRSDREVWLESVESQAPRKLFDCPASCRNPQFSPDNRALFVVVDVTPTDGGLWKIDLNTGNAAEFIRSAAIFRVIQRGPYAGLIIADQPTLTASDGTPYDRPYYVFFIFRPSGSRIGRISRGTDDDVEVLLMEYSQ